ncbi:OLC1v1013025C1 [Oldenlandia corymbosa var. corymbosa]|uniref:OLC1v1013025C1 n=1 Tax=Oldenlandia corymbosa var. corymbosa TaxID=529605 RepID=A0AAV1E0K4_OLDCO|nr:OLC1v1013025C1 [Oldenlandia corymbosa var. corymbosa]
MHGREQREGENQRRIIIKISGCFNQHMRSVSLSTTKSVADAESSFASSVVTDISSDSFCKDGRRISIGDCALFKPAQDSPPFIGIIRWLTSNKENNLNLGVNWLYRPAEVKLGKGIPLDASPNEIFYSFHKDEIPAASLLHPCKVAFLPQGVELSSEISSFVCRRVYDIDKERLWWLTDQDYINDRQEEVDKLLQKTRIDMDASFVPENRSPKPTSNSMSTSQFKPASDNGQNSATSVPLQTKGKKRERGEQSLEPAKRERSLKQEDGESSLCRSESSLRSEIAKMTEKGGLVDSELVEKLVQLMHPNRADKKMDLISRSMLASVIAGTDKFDCLNRFLQLKGLPVFDEWLQDVHKGKIGDGDKSAEEFLLILLRALDKLPVNLHALQTCNIGRSVNHLRSHKNSEIQKKARSLVDTWKKRVEAEMNMIDAKSESTQIASWPSKSRISDSHGSRNLGGSNDVALKSSVTQLSASKAMSVKVSQVESTAKSASSSPVAVKSASSPASVKDSQPKSGCASEVPLSFKEDKSSCSSQSLNCSQPFSGKEDARSSTAGSMSVNKISGGSRHRKSVNGFPGTSLSANQKESGNSSNHRNSAQEKFSHSVSTGEKAFEAPAAEGGTHKLIVKISNRGRSPAQSGGSFEDPSVMSSRASSPVLSDIHEVSEHNTKEKGDADVNAESWQSNDFKDLQTGSDDGDGSPAALPEEEQCRTVGDTRRVLEVPKAASSSSGGNDTKSGKLHDTSYSSMNALVESCVKYSEANMSMSLPDDMGMNLLASVAAGEMSKSDLPTPSESPQGYNSVGDECTGEDAKLNSSPKGITKDHSQPNSIHNMDLKQSKLPVVSCCKEKSNQAPQSSGGMKGSALEETSQATVDCATEVNDKVASNSPSPSVKASKDGVPDNQSCDQKEVDMKAGGMLIRREGIVRKFHGLAISSLPIENKDVASNNVLDHHNSTVIPDGNVLRTTLSVEDADAENVSGLRVREADENHGSSSAKQSEIGRVDAKMDALLSHEDQKASGSCSDVIDRKNDCLNASAENVETAESLSVGSSIRNDVSAPSPKNVVENLHLEEANKDDSKREMETEQESLVAPTNSYRTEVPAEMDRKMHFDLNEGFTGDDGKFGESVNPVSTAAALNSIPATITVAAAAKGPFVPPVDLLKNKVELGWKGSAATSAFRPAEPRKLQLPLGSPSVSPPDGTASKSSRAALDIDLNAPGDTALDDLGYQDSTSEIGLVQDVSNNHDRLRGELTSSVSGRSSGGLDLDLNRVDEATDLLQCSTSSCLQLESPFVPLKVSSSFDNKRDFDLNNGPSFEDAAVERSSFALHGQGTTHPITSQPAIAGLRMKNNLEAGNFSSWLSPGTSYSSITIPSALPDRGEQPFPIIPPGQPQRTLDPPGSNPFASDAFRGSVFPASPAVPFAPSPFSYHMFPFGTTLPLASATFPVGSTSFMDSASGGRIFTAPANSQFLGPVGAVSSQYPRNFMVSLSDGSNNGGVESNRKWSGSGLDLNAGPGVLEIESREENLARQLNVGSSQVLSEEQARMFPLSGGVLKRKEPDAGWDRENLRYKQSSWH